MRQNLNLILTGLLSATLMMSCGEKKEEEEKDEDGESVSAVGAVGALKEMAAKAEEMGKNGPVETVDFRSLKELLPADADGLARKEATGEKNGAAGFTISTANGKYSNDDSSETIELSIVDGGGTAMMMGLAAWSMIEVDKETENGYEKTGKMGDNKSYEKYDNANKDGEIAVLVNKRFIVTAKGRGVSMDKLKEALEDIDLDKLGSMK
ncbi:transposase [Spirosoma sp. KNUC1025]|uniref:transposase n=1 Tax=Spirosoma sp. KNUC1025 TaxID=2894082 RepID=UPI00386A24FE|nr:transposase [Spirosoma sp. KNUC1025]